MLNKQEIKQKIYECKTDEDIEKFVASRLKELEDASKEITVGQNYTDTFDGFISSRVNYKPADKLPNGHECPSLVYDDPQPYINMVKELRKQSDFGELSLIGHTMFWQLNEYLPNGDMFDRLFTYLSRAEEGKISIKEVKEKNTAVCSEKSGLSHNLFKFLGIDSTLASGTRNNEPHAYNVIYPKGYGENPAVIFDPSHHLSLQNESGARVSVGYFNILTTEEYEKLKKGEPVSLDMTRTEEKVRQLYGNGLDGFKMEMENPSYGIGLNDKTKTIHDSPIKNQ